MTTYEIISSTTKINEANTKAKAAYDACVALTSSNWNFLTTQEKAIVLQAQKVIENLRERTNEHEIQNYLETGKFTR